MKIANIIISSQNGGAEQVFIDYMKILKKLDHQVCAIIKNDAPYINKINNLEINVSKIHNRFGFYDFFSVKELVKILLKENPDALIAHAGRATVIARSAIKKIKNKKIFLIAVNHSTNVKRSIGADFIFSINKPIFYKTIDAGQSVNSSFVIPNAIDIEDANLNYNKNKIAEKETVVIGALGRFDRTKGFDFLIKAIDNLKNCDKKIILNIAGAGYFEDELRFLVSNLNLSDRVNFLGWIEDKKKFFAEIDIFCLPSLNEPFGLVLLEAMKYAKPIITTDADGPKEILSHNTNAIFVKLNSEKSLDSQIAEAITDLIKNNDKCDQIVKNASKRLFEQYSMTSLENRLKEIFNKV